MAPAENDSESHEYDNVKSIYDVLEDKNVRYKFKKYLHNRYSVESLLFLDYLNVYTKITSLPQRNRGARTIYDKFIKEGAQYQLNLQDSVRKAIEETTEFSETSFDAAKAEIIKLLDDNYFASFKQFLKDPSREEVLNTKLPEELYPQTGWYENGVSTRKSTIIRLSQRLRGSHIEKKGKPKDENQSEEEDILNII